MHRILDRYGVFWGIGTFSGKLYDLGRYPGAVASTEDSDRVVGEIYRLEPVTNVLGRLDEYEGNLFRREQLPARLEGKRKINTWIYLYQGPVDALRRIPSGDYVAFLNESKAGF